MRPKPHPENAVTLPEGAGYQLCARCGKVLTAGEWAFTETVFHVIYWHILCEGKNVTGVGLNRHARVARFCEEADVIQAEIVKREGRQ